MHEIIKAYLDEIEKHSKRIECCIQGIYGFCEGMEVVARDFPRQNETCTPTQETNGLIADNKN